MRTRSRCFDLAALALQSLVLLLAVAPGAIAADVCATPSFTSKPFKPIPDATGTPAAIAAGSFYQHDGEPGGCACDLAVAVTDPASPTEDLLVFLRGENNGDFVMRSENPVIKIGDNPIALVADDYVETAAGGRDALAVLTGKPGIAGSVALFVADEAGSYRRLGAPVAVGRSPQGMAAGDFNQDGKRDLVVLSNDPEQQVRILFGDGAGGFAAENPATLTGVTNGRLWSLAAGKFQGNAGPDDIAIANSDQAGNLRITIARRSPSGSFEALTPIVLGKGGDAYIASGRFSNGMANDHDLAVAFTDDAPSGKAVVLAAGVQPVPPHAVDNYPKSVRAGDLNGDGKDELVIATFTATNIAAPDGKITVFTAGQSGAIDFGQALWDTKQSQILPRFLAAGRFGRDPGTGSRHLGLAAANAPDLNTISVYVGNGAGVFAAPASFATPIRPDAVLFTAGDFHSASGDDKLIDLAYVRPDEAAGEYVVGVLLNNGDRTFREAPIPSVRVGREPLLLVAGRFDSDLKLDLAVIDANPGDGQGRARIRILRGQGETGFARIPGLPDTVLEPGEAPVDAATGQFKFVDPGRASDLAIVSRTTTGGTLKLLLNDGNGRFSSGPVEGLTFKPARVVSSNRLREGGVYDVIVQNEEHESFVFFENNGDAQFIRQESFEEEPNDAAKSGQFVVGDADGDPFDDIIFLDRDKTVDVFRNTGGGTFSFMNSIALASLPFNPEQSAIFLMDIGGPQPALVALVGTPAIVTAKGNGLGGFTDARIDVLEARQPGEIDFKLVPPRTDFSVRDRTGAEWSQVETLIEHIFVGRLGDNTDLTDFAFLSRVEKMRVEAGACPSDPRPNPGPERHCEDPDRDALFLIPCPSSRCTGPCGIPPPRMCETERPPNCTYGPRPNPYCEIKAEGFFITVFRNTCDG